MMPEKRTRIFVDAHCFDKEYQGTRTFVKEIYSVLQHKNDLQLFLAAYNSKELKKNFPNAKNTTFIKYRSRSAIIRLAFDIPMIIKKYKIQYAHFQYISPIIKNCKHIVTLHDLLFEEHPEEFPWMYRLIKRFFFRRSAINADVITTVSNHSGKSIQKYLAPSQNISIVENAVSLRYFEEYDKPAAKNWIRSKYGIGKFILYVSRIEPRKNHLLILKAWKELQLYEKGYHLVFLGRESIKVKQLNHLLKTVDPEIRKNIFFLSDINDEELLQFYRAAELFVYPSKAEGFGIPPLEAAAMRIPVLCANASSMEEFSFFGQNHVNPHDAELFKKRVKELTTKKCDETFLRNISEKIKERYSWKNSAEKLYQLITCH